MFEEILFHSVASDQVKTVNKQNLNLKRNLNFSH